MSSKLAAKAESPASQSGSVRSEDERLASTLRYDRTTAALTSLVVVIAVPVVWLAAVWLTNQVWAKVVPRKIEIVDVEGTGGGDPLGKVGERQRIQGEGPAVENPADVEEESLEEFQSEEVPEQVLMDIADVAADLAEPELQKETMETGVRGHREGTGEERGFGNGPGDGALPRHLRWELVYDRQQTLDEYARQLDFFRIELGAIHGSNRISYVSSLAAAAPNRKVETGGNDPRLYMIWRGGDRRRADLALLRKAGVSEGDVKIALQFIPPDVEQQMAVLERDFANRPAEMIRQTRFGIRPAGDGYEMFVIDQQYFESQ